MINISVECIKSGKTGAKLLCNGSVRGDGDDIRREMVGALLMFDEINGGDILRDAFGDFLAERTARKMGKKRGEDDE